MKTLTVTLLLACFALTAQTFGQHLGLTFEDGKKQGISIPHLDSVYKSAIHTDSSQAVFKT
ncbi:MAG: hypothetical protein Q7K43_00070, partial [Candidatus Woesearchaeota archaeon]|nr:hypothetical protein [Candidatus Woesearchaeota archaeon]